MRDLAAAGRISRWAALAHRLSGLALALFLPMHFLALGLALDGAASLDAMLAFAELPLVKAAEWGLVVLLTLHLGLGIRVLALELLPWGETGGLRLGWVWGGAAAALVAGGIFIAGAF